MSNQNNNDPFDYENASAEEMLAHLSKQKDGLKDKIAQVRAKGTRYIPLAEAMERTLAAEMHMIPSEEDFERASAGEVGLLECLHIAALPMLAMKLSQTVQVVGNLPEKQQEIIRKYMPEFISGMIDVAIEDSRLKRARDDARRFPQRN